MMKNQSQHTDVSVHQTVTDFIKFKTDKKSIQIGWTNKAITAFGGLVGLAGFFQWKELSTLLTTHVPFQVTSPNATPLGDIMIAYILGILAGAKKLTQASYLRRDQGLAKLFELDRIPSQSTFTRFFQRFSQTSNQAFFNPLWNWAMRALPSKAKGYILDFDSTQLLHEDAHDKEGVRTGHTAFGIKRCYHPLLASLTEVGLVAGFWLRPGNVRSDNNIIGFTQQIFSNLPPHIRIGMVRGDSGFCNKEWLQLLEQKNIPYIVVARLHAPLRNLIRNNLEWKKTALKGTEVAEVYYQGFEWESPRRIVLIRHEVQTRPGAGGRELFDCTGYRFQALVTSLGQEVDGLEVWRTYNGRGDMENIIKELGQAFALPELCLKDFWATEAAMGLAVVSYNLCVLFQRLLCWKEQIKASTLRFRLFCTGGLVSQSNGIKTIKLAVPRGPTRDWWRRLFEKLSSQFPNCNAVEELMT